MADLLKLKEDELLVGLFYIYKEELQNDKRCI
jgi:hypothetical protein